MEYTLRNGQTINIRPVRHEDAQAIIDVIRQADTETRFLAREPEEFTYTLEQEEQLISGLSTSEDHAWFVAEYNGRVVGQCAIDRVSRYRRFRHRAGVSFVLLQAYCGQGIGGKLMLACIDWARQHGVSQLELEVIGGNDRALRMYEHFGFVKVGEVPNAIHYADGTVAAEHRMVLRLD